MFPEQFSEFPSFDPSLPGFRKALLSLLEDLKAGEADTEETTASRASVTLLDTVQV